MDVVTRVAPAKLNIALQVFPPRPDGMHPIRSWMVAIDLCDEIEVMPLSPGCLSRYAILWHDEALVPTEIDWSIQNDLAVRAHHAVEAHVGRELPVQMKLEKRIPVGSGLGGGSSDAAAMLLSVNAAFDLHLGGEELLAIAATVGSDVPFFLGSGSSIVTGLGERVEAGPDVPALAAVVILPDQSCSTPDVYRRFDAINAPTSPDATFDAVLAGGPTATLFNDLAPAVFSISPSLEAIARETSAVAEQAIHVTGSGSALFILCDDAMHAAALAGAITTQCAVAATAVTSYPVGNGTMGDPVGDSV